MEKRFAVEIHDEALKDKAKACAALEKIHLWQLVEKALKQYLKGK